MRGPNGFAYLLSPAGAFAMVLAGVLGVVIGGDAFTRTAQPAAVTEAAVVAQQDVLQDGSDWLSEAYWARKRSKRLKQSRQLGYFTPQFNPFSSDAVRRQSGSRQSMRDNGHYRTVCVRLCDGYYFPISFSTRRDRFGRDEQVCQSSCAGDTRLFYHPSGDPNAEELKDRNGNRYDDLANAYVYRTEYKPSCQCRAQPWTDEARQRHAMYATEEWQQKSARIARRATRQSGERKAWRVVRPAKPDEGKAEIETAAVAGENSGVDGQQASEVNVIRPSRSSRMGLGGGQQASSRQRTRVIKRRDRSWRRQVFNNID